MMTGIFKVIAQQKRINNVIVTNITFYNFCEIYLPYGRVLIKILIGRFVAYCH